MPSERAAAAGETLREYFCDCAETFSTSCRCREVVRFLVLPYIIGGVASRKIVHYFRCPCTTKFENSLSNILKLSSYLTRKHTMSPLRRPIARCCLAIINVYSENHTKLINTCICRVFFKWKSKSYI
jgi:hypothetical protein